MKTQIIQLDKNDDYISVRDRMNWIQTGRILLLWPEDGRILESQLELNLVQRHASHLGAQLALVTSDEKVNFNAKRLGILVFDNPIQAQDREWPASHVTSDSLRQDKIRPDLEILRKLLQKTRVQKNRPVMRILFFSISMLAILALGLFILPGATIMLVPRVETQSITISVTADPSLDEIDLETNSVPIYLQDVIVEGRDSAPTTGSVVVPDQVAFGSLRFTNTSDADVVIPEGIVVATTGSHPVRFTTLVENDQILAPGKSIRLEALALLPGTSGNLPPDTLVVIKDQPGLRLAVTNTDATRGGMDTTAPAPSEKDLLQLRQRLTDQLRRTSTTQLQAFLPSGDILIPGSMKVGEILSETFSPTMGEAGSELSLSMRVKFQTQVIAGSAIRSLVMSLLDADLPTAHSAVSGTLVVTPLNALTMNEAGKAQWSIRSEREVKENIVINGISDLVKGSSVKEAASLLDATLPLKEPARIDISPSWWPRLPLVGMRIRVLEADSK